VEVAFPVGAAAVAAAEEEVVAGEANPAVTRVASPSHTSIMSAAL
jgi:hypothetical protein